MPKLVLLQSNFTAGEFTPKLYGRVDIDRYQNAVKLARNGYSFVHGGWRWRMGTRFVAEVKNGALPCRLIPYIIDQDEAYVVEVCEGPPATLRYYTGAGRVEIAGIPVENSLGVFSPTSRLKYAQDDGVLYLVHHFSSPGDGINAIERLTPTTFAASSSVVYPKPSTEIQEMPVTTLTLSTLVVGFATATAGAACFQNADIGRFIRAGSGYAEITGFTSTTVVTVNNGPLVLGARAFNSLTYASTEWLIDSSPQTTLTPSAIGSIGAVITLTLGVAGWKDNAQYSHVGKLVEVNGGMCEILTVTTTVAAQARIWAALSSATAAASNGWVLRIQCDQLFNAITFHEQRMVLANTFGPPGTTYGLRAWNEPQTVFLSVSGLQEFSVGATDDDAVELVAKSETATPIEHLVSFGDLIVFTGTTVFRITGGLEKPITFQNFQIKAQSEDGANTVRPIKVGNELVYAEAGGKRVLALGYRAESDRYQSGDVSTLAEHLLRVGVVDMAYLRRPDPLLLCVLTDGTLAVCAIDRDQNVVGWSLCTTDGFFEAVCVTPYNNQSLAHFIVRRTIGGADHRYVERWEDGRETDCCIVGTAGVATMVWAGFGHLEGETLDVIADGSFIGQKVVTGGQITLDTAATSIEAGLHYDAQLQLLKAEVAGQAGTNQADAVSVHRVIMRVQDSVGCKVRGKPVVFTAPVVFDAPPPTFTGDHPLGVVGTQNDEILIERDKPYPFTLTCIMRAITINAG